MDQVRAQPVRAVQLVAWKFLLFWNRTSFPQIEGFETAIVDLPLSKPPFWRSLLILPFALVGIGLAFAGRGSPQRPERIFAAVSALSFSTAIAFFFITDRYRIAILPLVIILALIPFEAMATYWRAQRRASALAVLLALVVLVFLTAADRLAIDHTRIRRDLHIHDALRLAKAELYDAAISEYQLALRIAPSDPQVVDGLARLYARAGLDSLALQQLRGLLRDDPQNARSWYNLGNQYRRLDQHASAIEAYQQSLAVQPTREAAWNNMGESYRALGDTLSAERAYRQALAIVPGYEQAWNNLGGLLALRGDVAASEVAFRNAIEANPRYEPGWINLAILLTNAGRYEEALQEWRTILRIHPNHPLASETVHRIESAGGESP
jgi:tetratricopeptide (TPR) repeat protein